MVVFSGYFNAKTKSKSNNFPTNIIDKYTKSEINTNGEKMVEFCVMNNLQTQTYPSNNMAITSPLCQHNRLQNEHTQKKPVQESNRLYFGKK